MASASTLSAPPLPRRLLNDILLKSNVTPGSRILDLGCGDGSLVDSLNALGYEAQGFRETKTTSEHLTGLETIVNGNAASGYPFPPHRFQLIIARDMGCYLKQRNAPELYITTANVLSSLVAGGKLVILDPVIPHAASDSARIEWLTDHFSWFPAQCQPRQYSEGIGWYLKLRFLRDRKLDQSLITVTAPTPNPSRLEWHRLACQIAQSVNSSQKIVA
jgi:cyclopropane fatty-acyl-phospholipid synthase-like methyltransferase